MNSVDSNIMPLPAGDLWFKFEPVEVVKADGGDPKKSLLGRVKGIATVELPDKVNGDIIDLDTIRTQFLTKSGIFTYEHPRGVMNTVGFPSSAKVVPYVTDKGVQTRALEVEGYIYLNDDLGAAIYYKSKTMLDAGGQRALGWSLEGPGLVRNSDVALPTRKVRDHEPKSIAICLEPANEYALWSVAASATAQDASLLSARDLTTAAREFVAELSKSARSVNAPRSTDSCDDGNIALLLKSFPTLTWAQGEQWVAKIRDAVHKVMEHKE